MGFEVDADKLREFARLLDDAAGGIGPLAPTTALDAAAGAVAGTTASDALDHCAITIAGALRGIGDRVTAMSALAHTSAGNYRITEDAFSRALHGVDL